jgi:membrane protease YdiL (CAAX protease family)
MNSRLALQNAEQESPRFDRKGVFWFLGLTFGLTWLLELTIYLRGGRDVPGAGNTGMLAAMMPAFIAILLGLFFLPASPIYYKRPAGRGRWFYYFFMVYTALHAASAVCAWLDPSEGMEMVTALATQLPLFVGLILLIVLRFVAGREAMARVWLSGGSGRYWLFFGLAFTVFYILQPALNALFGLGPSVLVPDPAPQGIHPVLYTIFVKGGLALFSSVVMIVAFFGEEYGWRGYLQSELFKLGRIRGALLLGAIWGIWHWPLILMGHNYPDHPLLGLALEVFQCASLGMIISYALLKSRSIVLVAFLHSLNNLVPGTLIMMGLRPFDNVFSFEVGIYGTISLAVIAFITLRDPIWRGKGGGLPEPAPFEGDLSGSSTAVAKAPDQAVPVTGHNPGTAL